MMSSSQRIITDTNKAPLVQVLTLMFLIIAILACFTRSSTKLHMIKTLKVDDLLVIISSLLATGQSIVIFVTCEHGLGQQFGSLSLKNIDIFFKGQYAADTLFIASMLCSKLSGAVGLRLMRRPSQKWLILGCEIVVGLWGFTALIVNFFKCPLPAPWDYSDSSRCIDRNAFWTYYSVANIVTDIAIIAIVADNVRRIQTSWSKKTLVISVFGSRILVVPATAAQIYYQNKAFSSEDTSFSMWEAAIAIQLVQFLAIFTVCVPNLKPFLDSLESGQIRIDDLRRQGKSHSDGYPTYQPGYSRNKSGQISATGAGSRSHHSNNLLVSTASQRSNAHELVDLSKSKARTANAQTLQQKQSWDGQSQKSHSSQIILIHQTWEVDVQSAPDAR